MYLVTGGCGFIGSHLVDLLIEKGFAVRVLDDLSNSSKKYLPAQAEFFFGSITDEEVLQKALKGVTGIFHLAARVSVAESIIHWHKNHLINCGGTVLLFEMAKKIPIIVASSAAVYGDTPNLPHTETSPSCPLSPYAVDKLSCEMQAKVAWEIYRTPSVCFRFFNVYGPRQNPDSPYSGVISRFAEKIIKREPLTIYGDGLQRRDFIYVKDVVHALFKMMLSSFEGAHIYNLCTGIDHSINDLADLMSLAAGIEVKKEYALTRAGEIRFSRGDPSKLLKEAGIYAGTSLEVGLRTCLHI